MEDKTIPIAKRTEPWGDGEVITYAVGESRYLPPDEISLILGDALSDYRASLDHLAWQLVCAAGEPLRPDQVYFPVIADPEKFAGSLRRMLPGVGPMVASIVERHQPFRNGSRAADHPLSILHEWNRLDKHRAISVVAVGTVEMNADLPGEYDNFEILHRERRGSIDYPLPGTDILRIYGKRKDLGRDHGVRVLFGGSMTVAHEGGKTLETALNVISAAVDDVLKEFERLP